jgi:hypothetical protein
VQPAPTEHVSALLRLVQWSTAGAVLGAARSSCTRTALYFSFLEVGPPASSPPGLTFAILGVTEIPGRPRSGDLVVMTRHGWSRRCDDTI